MVQWSMSLEANAFALQNKVSVSNSEQGSKSYIIAITYGNLIIINGLRFDVDIENLFDKEYVPHLAGYNRNLASDVPVGTRLPGPGRSGFVRLRWAMQ